MRRTSSDRMCEATTLGRWACRMISVCMAAYNGSRWIEMQLRSVLPQLGSDDELVLVDDCSTDDTLEKVARIEDSRIRVFRNESNLGVDPTFERALAAARGGVLFLCDQDDIWHPHRVSRVMQAFAEHPEVTLVLSDARIIDSAGAMIMPSYFRARGPFIPGVVANVLKSKFLGCAMAVRSEMRARFLPFPSSIPGHDMWIGVINEFYGKTLFIPEPLVDYRRHGRNTSPERRQSMLKMLLWRWQLSNGLARRIVSQAMNRAH